SARRHERASLPRGDGGGPATAQEDRGRAGAGRDRPRSDPEEMTKKAAAFVLTAALAAAALWWSNRKTDTVPAEPESAIWRILDQSRAGSVEGYLDCFTGTTRAQLETTARAMTLPKFALYLKESVSRVKGVAVYDVTRPAPETAALVVEYVYQD